MTFWQDARPATPRFRRRRPHATRIPVDRGRGSPATSSSPWPPSCVVAGAAVVRSGGAADADAGGTMAPGRRVGARRVADRGCCRSGGRPRPTGPATLLPTVPTSSWWPTTTSGRIGIADGKRHWATEVPARSSGPTLAGFTVLIATEDSFVALDRATGTVRWEVRSPEPPGPVALVGHPAGEPARDRCDGGRWPRRDRRPQRPGPVVGPVPGQRARADGRGAGRRRRVGLVDRGRRRRGAADRRRRNRCAAVGAADRAGRRRPGGRRVTSSP